METLRVGLLGCGNVGAAVARMLHDHADQIAMRSGAHVEILSVAVRDLSKPRDVPLSADLFTDDPRTVVNEAWVDVVVELIGGVEPARSLILQAFGAGKSVVTANKELLATASAELLEAAVENNVDLLYEASVGGGNPAPPREPGRGSDPAVHGHRERNDELHPDPDGRGGPGAR